MYKIKQLPEDFLVREMMRLEFEQNGRYSYYLLKKKGLNTIDAVDRIAKKFKVSPRYINFAGTKDRSAVTEQHISISRGPGKDLEIEGISLKFLGKGSQRLNLGTLDGNEFEIIIRNIDKRPEPIRRMRNLFDDQRFGNKKNNHIIGKAIVMKDFRKACDLIDEDKVKGHVVMHPNDCIGALKTLPKKILLLYIHSYQSYLWNEMAKDSKEEKLPLIGFSTEGSEEVDSILEKEGITRRDFIIRQIPELSAEGGEREVFAEVNGLELGRLEDDELNPGKKKVRISFRLGKGSYATQAIKQMFSVLG